jgi:hypothetical protein
MSSTSVLALPNFEEEFVIETDVTIGWGWGCAVSKWSPNCLLQQGFRRGKQKALHI